MPVEARLRGSENAGPRSPLGRGEATDETEGRKVDDEQDQHARERLDVPYPVRYGTDGAPNGPLVEWLESTPEAVLVGTRSLWKGVDLPATRSRWWR